jgi:hypothetical protein
LLLIAVFVLLWKKSAAFRNFWIGLWNVLKRAAGAAWHWIKNAAITTWNWIKTKVSSFVSWVSAIPGRVSRKLSSMWSGLKNGFKSAINWVIGKWNSIHFSIPSFSVLGMHFGGGSIGVPQIPYMAKGGSIAQAGQAVVGDAGPELLTLPRGAQVTPLRGQGGGSSGGRQVVQLELIGGDREVTAFLRKMIRTGNLLQT